MRESIVIIIPTFSPEGSMERLTVEGVESEEPGTKREALLLGMGTKVPMEKGDDIELMDQKANVKLKERQRRFQGKNLTH